MEWFNSLLKTIALISDKSWSQLSKLIAIVFILGSLYTAYAILFNGLVIYDSTKLVKIDATTIKTVDKAIEMLLKYDDIEAVSVYLYQPDNLPKKNVQLIATIKRSGFAPKGDYPIFHTVGFTNPLDMNSYTALQYSEVLHIDGNGRSFLDYIVRYEGSVTGMTLYGLYRYATPAGSVVVVRNDKPRAEGELVDIYNTVRYLDGLLYR